MHKEFIEFRYSVAETKSSVDPPNVDMFRGTGLDLSPYNFASAVLLPSHPSLIEFSERIPRSCAPQPRARHCSSSIQWRPSLSTRPAASICNPNACQMPLGKKSASVSASASGASSKMPMPEKAPSRADDVPHHSTVLPPLHRHETLFVRV